jgi:uroporphyrinogen-III decarboxylase
MTGRQKLESAFGPQGAAEIGCVICYEGIYVRDHWQQVTDCPWWRQFEPDVQRQLAWRRQMLQRTGMDWFALPACLSRQQRQAMKLEARPDGVFRVDSATGQALRLEQPNIGGWDYSARAAPQPPMPRTPDEIDRLLPLEPDFDPESALADGRADLARLMLAEFHDLFPLAHVSSPLWRCYQLWGYEELMVKVATQPALVEHACRRYLELCRRQVLTASAMGAEGFWIEECFTDAVSPAAFARINLPMVQQLCEIIRQAGDKSIYYYCGNPHDRWDSLLASGADALSLEEGKKGFEIDIDAVVDRVRGRMAVLGNLDAIDLLEHADRPALSKEVARQLQAGRRNGGRFILSVGSPVTPGTSVARVREYCELSRELQRM